jgi:sugar phosphate isomerase/epimerase
MFGLRRCAVVALLVVAATTQPVVQNSLRAAPIAPEYRTGGFAIGCQAWSFNKFTAFEAIEKTAQAGARIIEFYPGQKMSAEDGTGIGPGMTDDAISKLKAQLAKYNVKAVAFGVTGIPRDEAGARNLFTWAKTMDIGVINTESTDAIDTIDKMVKEFDIKVGFHNHPRRNNDPNYKVWDPNYILSLVKDRDARVGACADTGHWVRSGIKPVDALRILRGRVVSSHLKDLHVFTSGGHDMPYGQGVSDIRGILNELRAQNFNGPLSVEYEYNWDNNVAEIAQCIGFVRGYGNAVMSGTQSPLRPGRPLSLFNGRDFTGWTYVLSDPNLKMEDVWSVKDGAIVCKGTPAGYIRTTGDYTNYVLRMQWRFKKPGNGGVLLRMVGADKVWPRSIEAQLQAGSAGDIWNIDEFPMQTDVARTNGRHTVKLKPTNERPIGQWNDYEITLNGGDLILKVNGEVQNTATGTWITPGKICLQSEGAEIEMRNIVLTPLE